MTSIKKQIQIGPCTLILGDCLEVMEELPKVGHVITDPPYEAIMHESKNKSGKRKLRKDGGADLKGLDFAPIDEIREEFFNKASEICEGWFLGFCTTEGVCRWADVINASDAKYKGSYVWIKPDAAPKFNGQGPARGHEDFVLAWCGAGFSNWNGGGKRGVYVANTNSKNRDRRHPTIKPLDLMGPLVTDFTKQGDVVLDPFMGSGTTLIAAMKLGRKSIGIELSEEYFDVAVDRITKAYNQMDLFNDVVSTSKPEQKKLELIGGALCKA